MICSIYIFQQIYSAMINVGVFFMTYVLGDEELLGTFAVAINVPMIIGLLVTPFLVKKLHGMYKLNLVGYILGTICRGLVIVGAMIGSIPMMLVCSALASFAISPLLIPTVINLVIALVLSRLKVEQVNAKLVSEKE